MASRFLNSLKINDAYTLPSSDGSNGQVIVTDGSGNLAFANPATSSSASIIYRDNFTGDGSTVAFTLQNSLSDEDQTFIYIDGVYQEKDNYSLSDKTITFTTAPESGHSVEVISISGINVGPTTIYQDNFTGDGLATEFNMAQSVDNEVKTMIYFNGVYQFKGTYTVNGSLITFDTAPANGVAIEVISIASAAAGEEAYSQELLFYGKASEAISKGDAVMFAGSQGDHFLFAKATQAAIEANHEYLIGLATQDLANNEYGYITEFGSIVAIDTDAYEQGDILWFDAGGTTAGALTTIEPAAPLAKIQVAAVIRKHQNEGVLFVRPTWFHALNELHDVNITSIADKDILAWNNTSGYWENTKTLDSLTVNTLSATTLTGTLSTAAQPNITSVGVLTSLSVDSGTTAKYGNFETDNTLGGYISFSIAGTTLADIGNGAQIVSGGSANDFGINVRPSNNLIFGTSNTERMRVTSGGDISIGNAASFGRLRLGHTGDDNEPLVIGDGTTPANKTGLYLRSDTEGIISVGSSGSLIFKQGGGYGSERMRIHTNGNVGINASSPATKLHVRDITVTKYVDANTTALLEAGEARLQLAANDDGNNGAGVILSNANKHWVMQNRSTAAGGYLAFGHVDTTSTIDIIGDSMSNSPLHITPGGQVRINSTATNASAANLIVGGVLSPGSAAVAQFNGFLRAEHGLLLHWDSDNTQAGYIQYNGTNGFAFTTEGSGSGNVGIGTTFAGYKLEVQGDMLVSSNVRLGTDLNATVTVGNSRTTQSVGSDTKLILSGKNLEAGGTYYGDYGQLLFNANSNYTGSARKWLVTNGLDAYKFSIIMGDSGQVTPTIGTAGGASGGTPVLTIDGGARVGIGTITPDYKLDVSGEIGIDSYIRHRGDTDTFFGFNGSDSFKARTGGGDRLIIGNNDSYFNTNLGIGVTSPDGSLHVLDGNGTKIRHGLYGAIGNRYSAWDTWIGNNISVATDQTSGIEILTSYTASGGSALKVGFNDLGYYQWSPATLSGLSAGDQVTIPTPSLFVDSAGEVGIGTGDPNQKLHINGASAGLNFTGGNNRIYFNGYRAMEGSTNGLVLQVGEGYNVLRLQGDVITKPTNPAWWGYVSDTNSVVTDGSYNFEITGLTELFDKSNDFNPSTGTFTAPVSGIYFISINIEMSGGINNSDWVGPTITVNGGQYNHDYNAPGSSSSAWSNWSPYAFHKAFLIELNANDYVRMSVDSWDGTGRSYRAAWGGHFVG